MRIHYASDPVSFFLHGPDAQKSSQGDRFSQQVCNQKPTDGSSSSSSTVHVLTISGESGRQQTAA